MSEHGCLGALRVWGFGVFLIELSSRKAVPEVTIAFTGPLHYNSNEFNGQKPINVIIFVAVYTIPYHISCHTMPYHAMIVAAVGTTAPC